MKVTAAVQPLFLALADNVAFAQNKHHISIFNAADSTNIIRLERLHFVNLSLAAVTGVGIRFDVKRTTGQSGGTALTSTPYDTADLSRLNTSKVRVATGATIVEGALRYPVVTNNDEIGLTAATQPGLLSRVNVFTSEGNVKRGVLRPGEGLTVKQITNSTVGSFAWVLQFAVIPM